MQEFINFMGQFNKLMMDSEFSTTESSNGKGKIAVLIFFICKYLFILMFRSIQRKRYFHIKAAPLTSEGLYTVSKETNEKESTHIVKAFSDFESDSCFLCVFITEIR